MKLYQVSILEVLAHRAYIEAEDQNQATTIARKNWDEDRARFFFDTFTVGRCQEIVCKELPADQEVQP
jgi:hypothetical protein